MNSYKQTVKWKSWLFQKTAIKDIYLYPTPQQLEKNQVHLWDLYQRGFTVQKSKIFEKTYFFRSQKEG